MAHKPQAQTDAMEELIGLLSRLPGLGPRSARRAVLYLLRKRAGVMTPLAQMMAHVADTARDCPICGNITFAETCAICADPRRDTGEICVVEDIADLWAMERGQSFQGRYHVLGGLLSALEAVGPEDIGIPRLLDRVRSGAVTEVILALNATVAGQTTAHYLADVLDPTGVRITSLAQGVPIGGDLDYLDDGTISAALRARRSL